MGEVLRYDILDFPAIRKKFGTAGMHREFLIQRENGSVCKRKFGWSLRRKCVLYRLT